MGSIPKVGDKVRLKLAAGELAGARGLLAAIDPNRLTVRLDETSVLVNVAPNAVTNFSLAARKAWQNMPHRKVGRPKGSKVSDRMSVTVRIDRELWHRFRLAEESGLVAYRTTTLNAWLSGHLAELESMRKQAS